MLVLVILRLLLVFRFHFQSVAVYSKTLSKEYFSFLGVKKQLSVNNQDLLPHIKDAKIVLKFLQSLTRRSTLLFCFEACVFKPV